MTATTNRDTRSRSSYHFFQDYRTRWSDNDQYGHVNNSVYYHLFDSIVNAYLIEQCGLDPGELGGSIGLVVASWCQFFAPLSFPQLLRLGLRVNKVGKSSVEYEVGVFPASTTSTNVDDASAPRPSAVGGYTHVFVDFTTRRPIVGGMPSEIRDGLTRLLVNDTANAEVLDKGNTFKL